VNLGWHRDRKENPISAPSIHVGALVGAAHPGQLCVVFKNEPWVSSLNHLGCGSDFLMQE